MKNPLMFGLSVILAILMALSATATSESAAAKTEELFNNWNTAAVGNSPICSPFFSISQPYYITYIDTYHWNYGSGTEAGGTISLGKGDGTEYGPWQVETKPGMNGVPNAWWIAHPNEVIPAGTYTIIDSDTSTWSQNSGSNGCGFSKVEGYPTQAATGTSVSTNGDFPTKNELTSIRWQFSRGDGSVISTNMHLNPDGSIAGYSDPNEARWGIEGNELLFYHEDGRVSTRFNSFKKDQGKWVISGPFLLPGWGDVTHFLTQLD